MIQAPHGYCPRCKEDREMIDTVPVRVPFSGGIVDMTKGVCAVCGHDMYEKNP